MSAAGSLSLLVVLMFGLLAAALGAIVTIRATWRRSGDDRGDWENTLATWKNLRDEGVLTDQEFRNIRTLVEPRLRTGRTELRGRRVPPADSAAGRAREGMD